MLATLAAEGSKPPLNMVFMFPDTLRAESFSSYGLKLPTTPNLDAFAKEAVRFEQAHTLHTQCSPSRCAMLTGRYMHVNGHRTQIHLIQSYETNYFRTLKENGVHVQYYGKNDVFSRDSMNLSVSSWSNDIGVKSGPRAYKFGEAGYYSMLSTGSDTAKDDPSNGDYRAVKKANEWMANSPPEPFLLFLPGRGAHPPYGAPAEFMEKEWHDLTTLKSKVTLRPPDVLRKPGYHSSSVGVPAYRNLTALPQDAFYRIQATYLSMISYTDWIFGELLDGIKRAGLYDRTAIFFSSDHGDFAGDFHMIEKWPGGADDILTRVPLYARVPGGATGIVSRAPVSLFDIPHTMCELQGINVNGDGPTTGVSGPNFAVSLLPQLLNGSEGDLHRVVHAEGGFSSWRDLHPGGSDHVNMKDLHGMYYPRALEEMQQGSPKWVMARNLTHKLVYRPKGLSELYDLVADPRELHNLWGMPRVASLQASLLQDLLSWMVDTADISPTHTDPRGMPSFPHAASSCAVSGDDGPYEASFEVLPAPNDLLAINGVDDFFEDGISSLEEFDALPAEELPASTDASLPCGGSGPLYKCAAAPIEQRADDLLSKLTLKQIIQQTWAPQGGTVAQLMKRIGDHGVGQLVYTFAKGATAAEKVASLNALQAKILNSSGIPASFSNEALHSALPGGTIFPELVTQGATWDASIVHDISVAIAKEAKACGIDVAFSPVLNMWVDARFGRLQEGFSENPTLSSAYAVAATKGLQGNQPTNGKWDYFNESKVISLAKHYLAYGAAEGGLNGAPAELSERTVREWYLAPWRSFAKAGGKGVMTSHNTVLNQPMHANDYLTNGVLRGELGFGDGIILSDCNDIPALVDFRVAANKSHAAAKGIIGGVDLDLQCGTNSAYTALETALKDGSVQLSKVKQAAKRVLMSKFAMGLFDKPSPDPAKCTAALNTKDHKALALRAAESGIVLLKNANGTLPLTPSINVPLRVAVVGELSFCSVWSEDECSSRLAMLGSYTQYDPKTVEVQTVAEALMEAMGSTASISTSLGATVKAQPAAAAEASRSDAVELAKKSDVVIAVLGDNLQTSSEWGDRDSLDLPGDQLPLLSALAAGPTPVIVVLVSGRTVSFGPGNHVLANVSALFSAFRPGQMGGPAIANLLLGKANPSGRLAQNWVRSSGQAMSGASPWLQWRVGKWVANYRGQPPDPDGRRYDNYGGKENADPEANGRADPLFHFGQGLSYTTFTMSNLTVVSKGEKLEVSLMVTNSGRVRGTSVVQVYVVDPVMEYVRPWKRLLTFARVTIDAGGAQRVHIPVTAEQLAFQDDQSEAGVWRVVPGEYSIRVGPSSVEDTLVAKVHVGEV